MYQFEPSLHLVIWAGQESGRIEIFFGRRLKIGRGLFLFRVQALGDIKIFLFPIQVNIGELFDNQSSAK